MFTLVGAGAALLAALVDKDLAVFGASLPWEIADAADVLTEFGQAQWVIIPAVALFLWGWRSGRDNLARWAFLLGVTVTASGGIANLIKLVFARWRPITWIEGDNFGFDWFAMGWTRASFPSGHATTVGAAAVVFALWFPKWRWGFLALGVAIAFTRVVLVMHYTSDVIAGWVLGAVSVTVALRIWWRVSPSTVPRAMTPAWPRSPVAIAWTAIAMGTLLRVLGGVWLPLGIDETYEVATCQSVTLAGFDHPPMVYWLTRLGLLLNGPEAIDPIWIRVPFIAIFAVSTWLAWRLACVCFSEAAGAWTAVLLNLSAFFAIAVGGWALPDGPLVATVLAMAFALACGGILGPRADGRPPWNPSRTWIVAGVALGLAALSKYQAAVVGVGVVAYLLTTPVGRRVLRTRDPWIGAGIALAMTLPVVLWNAQNDWASLRFQGGRASGEGGLHPLRFLEILGGQAGILLPWIWAPLLFEWVKSLRKGARWDAAWFFAVVGGIPIVLFLVISLWSTKGLPHWSGIGYLLLFPLLGLATAHELAHGKRALVRNWIVFSALALPLATVVGVSHAANGWATRLIALPPAAKDATLEALPWETVRTYLERRALDRIALNANSPPPPPPLPLYATESDADPCEEPPIATAPVAVATAAPVAVETTPLESFAPPPPRGPAWVKSEPKASRPPRTPDLDPPTPPLDIDVIARCGDEGLTTDRFFLAGINWRDTGKLAIAVHGLKIPVLCLSEDARQFAWTFDGASLAGADALVIVASSDAASAERSLAGQFRSIAPIATIRLNRGTSIAGHLTVLCALDFQPLPR